MKTQRVYDHAATDGASRFLVDRLWPRGLRKEALEVQAWLKEVAPSDDLRRWFAHNPAKWPEFRRRYRAELDGHPETWAPLLEAARHGDVVLLYGARDTEHNNAVALREYLEERL